LFALLIFVNIVSNTLHRKYYVVIVFLLTHILKCIFNIVFA